MGLSYKDLQDELFELQKNGRVPSFDELLVLINKGSGEIPTTRPGTAQHLFFSGDLDNGQKTSVLSECSDN